MDVIAALPDWMVWAAASIAGALALALVAEGLGLAFDLDS
jgi:hypothetical protein